MSLVIWKDREQMVSNPTEFPDVSDTSGKLVEIQEPIVKASIIVPEGKYFIEQQRVSSHISFRVLGRHD